jgi:hypothetical protein
MAVRATAAANKIERMIRVGKREEALVTFLEQIVMISPGEVAAMKARPSWPGRVAGIDTQIREIRALGYRFDRKRVCKLNVPTLLLTGSRTASPSSRKQSAH